MRINHRIASRSDRPFWLEIDRLGLDYKRGDSNNILDLGISVLNITEDQPQWPEVERLFVEFHQGVDLVTNIFTNAELERAEWLVIGALGHHGYPQAYGDGSYRDATYDVSAFCRICSIGGVQNAPFRFRAEPKAVHSQFLQLNWVFDEFFVRSEAREGLITSGITGIEFRSAVLHKNDQPCAQVEQMQVLGVLRPALDTNGLATVTCKEGNEEGESTLRLRRERPHLAQPYTYCGRVKYHFQHRGPLRFDRAAFTHAPDVMKTHEWFGSGARAFRLVIVSQRFRQVVLKAKWRGLDFEPVELVAAPT